MKISEVCRKIRIHIAAVPFAASAAACGLLFSGSSNFVVAAFTVAIAFGGTFLFDFFFDLLRKAWQTRSLPIAIFSVLCTAVLTVNSWQYCIFTRYRLLLAILSIPFLYYVSYVFLRWLLDRAGRVWRASTKTDRILVGVFLIISLFCSILFCALSRVFYRPAHGEISVWDVVYTSDTINIYINDAFFNFNNTQNDLRQLFFPVCAVPFAIWAKLFSYLFFFVKDSYAIGLVFFQWVALLISAVLFAKCLKLNGWAMYTFCALFFTTFSHLLFGFVLEQYIFPLAWFALFVYLFCERRDTRVLGAFLGGGMLTNFSLLPFMYTGRGKGVKRIWMFLRDMLFVFVVFLVVVAITGNCYMFAPSALLTKLDEYISFSGTGEVSVDWLDKLYQFTHFLSNQFCMLNPFVEVKGQFGMQMALPAYHSVSVAGILIFVLELASFVYCRKNRMAWLCGYWILFSIGLLFVLGWGTVENGLILYVSYFNWAYLCLPVLAVKQFTDRCGAKRGERKKFEYALIAGCGAVALVFFFLNGANFLKILEFGIQYYPA